MLKPGLTRAPRAEAQVAGPHKHSKPCKGVTHLPIPRQHSQTEYRRFCASNGKPLDERFAGQRGRSNGVATQHFKATGSRLYFSTFAFELCVFADAIPQGKVKIGARGPGLWLRPRARRSGPPQAKAATNCGRRCEIKQARASPRTCSNSRSAIEVGQFYCQGWLLAGRMV
jgi:hypothetical protein